jgi:hypothetical protein
VSDRVLTTSADLDETALGLLDSDVFAAERAERALLLLSYADDFYALEELLGWWGNVRPLSDAADRALTQLAAVVETGGLEVLLEATQLAKKTAARLAMPAGDVTADSVPAPR